MVIGITGNSGSGKSEISKILAEKINAKIIDADKIVKKLSEPGNKYYKKIVELFGNEVLENNILNKKKIAEIIYQNKEKREELNKLTFKYVVDEIKNEIKNEKQKNIIIDAPLLFESGLDKVCDYTVAVLANTKAKIERICARDKLDEETANSRLNIQQPDEFYRKNAKFIVENNGKIEEINWEEICTKFGKN